MCVVNKFFLQHVSEKLPRVNKTRESSGEKRKRSVNKKMKTRENHQTGKTVWKSASIVVIKREPSKNRQRIKLSNLHHLC